MSDMTEAPSLGRKPLQGAGTTLDLLSGVQLRLTVEVGAASLTLAELLKLGENSVVELDRQANDLLDILVNDKPVAKGEIVENGGRYGIKVVQIVDASQPLRSMERPL